MDHWFYVGAKCRRQTYLSTKIHTWDLSRLSNCDLTLFLDFAAGRAFSSTMTTGLATRWFGSLIFA